MCVSDLYSGKYWMHLRAYGVVCGNIIYANPNNDINTRNREINGCSEVRTTDINIFKTKNLRLPKTDQRDHSTNTKNEQSETNKKMLST